VAGAREQARRHRVGWVLAGDRPALRPCNAILVAQKFEQHRGKHRVAILAAFPVALGFIPEGRFGSRAAVGACSR
jgi:hypothetical protein